MSAQVESQTRPVPDAQPLAGDDGVLAAMFSAHAAHLHDYCLARLKDDDEAAQATQATFVVASELRSRLWDLSRQRAWLFALARVECTAREPGRAEIARAGQGVRTGELADEGPLAEADDDEPATIVLRFSDIQEYAAARQRDLSTAFAALPDSDREVLDLVYRHEVSAAELPAILGISAELARTVLAADVLRLEQQGPADLPELGEPRAPSDETMLDLSAADLPPLPGAERLSRLPLAELPGSVWPATLAVATDPGLAGLRAAVVATAGQHRPDGFPMPDGPLLLPSRKKLMLASGVLCVGLIAPAVTGAGLFAYFSPSSHNTHLQVPGYGLPPAGVAPPIGVPTAAATTRGGSARPSHSHSISSLFPFQPGNSSPAHSVKPKPPSKPSSKVSPTPSSTSRTSPASPWPSGSPTGSPSGSPSTTPSTSPSSSPSPSSASDSPSSDSSSAAASSSPDTDSPSPSDSASPSVSVSGSLTLVLALLSL